MAVSGDHLRQHVDAAGGSGGVGDPRDGSGDSSVVVIAFEVHLCKFHLAQRLALLGIKNEVVSLCFCEAMDSNCDHENMRWPTHFKKIVNQDMALRAMKFSWPGRDHRGRDTLAQGLLTGTHIQNLAESSTGREVVREAQGVRRGLMNVAMSPPVPVSCVYMHRSFSLHFAMPCVVFVSCLYVAVVFNHRHAASVVRDTVVQNRALCKDSQAIDSKEPAQAAAQRCGR